MSEGTPYAGFYRWVKKDSYGGKKYATPVAYWPGENGELHCRVDDKDVTEQHGRDIWIHVCDDAVPEEWYRRVAENDEPEWHDGIPLQPTIGDNEPPDNILKFEMLRDKIEAKSRIAAERLAGAPIADEAEAGRIGIMAEELADLWKEADEQRKAERKPHDEVLKAIQAKWAPVLLACEIYKNVKYKLLTPWLQKLEAEQKAAAAEAAAAGEPPVSAERASRPRVGTRSRAISLKAQKSAIIVDFAACLEFFKDSADIQVTLQDLANKAVRAGITVPGVEVKEEQKAV